MATTQPSAPCGNLPHEKIRKSVANLYIYSVIKSIYVYIYLVIKSIYKFERLLNATPRLKINPLNQGIRSQNVRDNFQGHKCQTDLKFKLSSI